MQRIKRKLSEGLSPLSRVAKRSRLQALHAVKNRQPRQAKLFPAPPRSRTGQTESARVLIQMYGAAGKNRFRASITPL